MISAPLPTGTVTFAFTDIEGSTRMLQALGARYSDLLDEHRRLVRAAAAANGGIDFGSEGDALFLVFQSAAAAVAAAVEAQRALAAYPWPAEGTIRVRMGVHTGEATLVGDNYVGLDLHRVARISAAGHGGQVLVSGSTIALAEGALPEGVTVRDMGERRLRDLSRPEHLYQLVIPGLPADFPPLRTLETTVNNLPTQVTSFVGREQQVAEGRQALETARLLTLTGPGGTGKTRLSLQIAAEIADQFPGGAFFVPLESITEPGLVASTIVGAIGVQDTTPRPAMEQLLEHLRKRRTLIVLDNFEQVLAAAPMVAEILRGSPSTTIIVTSRAPLRVSGEREYPVPPLGLPAHSTGPIDLETMTHYESVALFIERAVAVRPHFRVTNQNAPAVAEICARLDGLPLAIELAAARIKLLPPEAILSRLGTRLSLLAGGARDLPARQQTLRGAIAWSYELLDEPLRRLLARASIFLGGMQIEQAEAVCGPSDELGTEVFDGLAELVDQSLLRQLETVGEPRFAMLQTIRDFAAEQLDGSGERTAIARRHAEAFATLAESAAPHLLTDDRGRWLDALETEHDNLRSAIAWATEAGNVDLAVRLGASLWRFWQMRGYLREASDRLERVLAMPALASSPARRRRALDAAAGVVYWLADISRAGVLYTESLEIARQIGDPHEVGEALYNLSFTYSVDKRDLEKARLLDGEALAIFRDLGDRPWTGRTLWALSIATFYMNDLAAARPLAVEGCAIFRSIADQFGLGWALHTLGNVDFNAGRLEAARRAWTEMLRIFVQADDVSGIGTALANFRQLAVVDGDSLRALRLSGAAAAIVRRSGTDLANVIEEMLGRRGPGDAVIDQEVAERALAEGQAMTTPEAIEYALEKAAPPSEIPPEAWPVENDPPRPDDADRPAVASGAADDVDASR